MRTVKSSEDPPRRAARGAEPARRPLPIPMMRQTLLAGSQLPRHLHGEGYVAIVLRGRYWEANAAGRIELGAGDVAVHGRCSAHSNHVRGADAVVLNLRWPDAQPDGFGRLDDLDRLMRALERGDAAIDALVASMLTALPAPLHDWPDELAADLRRDPSLQLRAWAQSRGLAVESLSRGFARAFGATPKRVRFEQRTRRALALLGGSTLPLVQVALEAGFADQAGMTRAVRELTLDTPAALRAGMRQVNC
jgi:AraC-like DNA-binding protein